MILTLNLLFHLHHEQESERPTPRAYAEVRALILQADTLPIGCAWLAEHHFLPARGRLPAPLLFAVAAARETRRVRVGPCVLVLPLHAPLHLAEQIATADLLTDGRLSVGVGSGGNPEEFAALGISLDERRGRFVEGLEIVTGALRDAPFSYHGAHYQVPEVTVIPRPLQAVDDLLWVAANSVPSAQLAGRTGAHLLLARGVSVPDLQEQIAAYRAARAAHGLNADQGRIQVTRGVYVAPSDEQAWQEAAPGIAGYLRGSGRAPLSSDVQAQAQQGDFIVGSPSTCAAAIRTLADAVPITDLACDIFLYGMAHDQVARSLDLLGRVAAILGN